MTGSGLTVALTDTQVLALTMYGEARGEHIEGRISVGCVIRNRLERGKWGDTYRKVCWAPWQFSCWIPQGGQANYDTVQAAAQRLAGASDPGGNDLMLRECSWIAHGIVGGWIQDTVRGATHYHTADMKQYPAWAIGKTPVMRIGSHLYYAGIK